MAVRPKEPSWERDVDQHNEEIPEVVHGHADVTATWARVRLFSLVRKRVVISYGLALFGIFPLGCTTLTDKSTNVTTIISEPVAGAAEAKPEAFELSGRISVKGGRESFSSGVKWHHTASADEILLLSPLGQTLVQIQRDPGGVYLTTSDQESYYAADVESLTEQALGWRLPLKGLQYWVQGMGSPTTASAIDMDIDGRVAAIRQDGWEITYLRYFPMLRAQTAQAQTARPKLLVLKRGNLQVKLVIDDWNSSKLEFE